MDDSGYDAAKEAEWIAELAARRNIVEGTIATLDAAAIRVAQALELGIVSPELVQRIKDALHSLELTPEEEAAQEEQAYQNLTRMPLAQRCWLHRWEDGRKETVFWNPRMPPWPEVARLLDVLADVQMHDNQTQDTALLLPALERQYYRIFALRERPHRRTP